MPNTALCKLFISISDGPVAKSSTLMQAARVQIPCKFFKTILTMISLGAPVRSQAQASYLFLSSFWDYISPNDFGNIWMNFGFWLILCQEYINSKLFAVSTELWGPSLSSFDGPVSNCLLQMQGAWVQIQSIYSWGHPWKPRFKSGFHNSFWDYVVRLTEYLEWLWNYINEIWEWVLANSFSGIHKSKLICSASAVFTPMRVCPTTPLSGRSILVQRYL